MTPEFATTHTTTNDNAAQSTSNNAAKDMHLSCRGGIGISVLVLVQWPKLLWPAGRYYDDAWVCEQNKEREAEGCDITTTTFRSGGRSRSDSSPGLRLRHSNPEPFFLSLAPPCHTKKFESSAEREEFGEEAAAIRTTIASVVIL